jgi:alkaline phosphatase
MKSRIFSSTVHVLIVLTVLAVALGVFSLFGGTDLAIGNLVLRAQRGADVELSPPPAGAPGPAPWDEARMAEGPRPRNVILFVGDGMGLGHHSAASSLLHGPGGLMAMAATPHVGLMRTWCANDINTDSAASGTAMATGFKTHRKMVGVLPDGRPVRNLFEVARERGLATGVITTTGLVDATPACFTAHERHRDTYHEILVQMLDSETDLMLGGDWTRKKKARRNRQYMEMVGDIERLGGEHGYAVVRDPKAVGAAQLPLLGLFPPRPGTPADYGPQLAVSTGRALELLAADADGFVLVIENETTDELAHDNDIRRTMDGMRELDEAVSVALDFAATRGDTLVLVTADHDTGTLALVEGKYADGRAVVRWASGEHSSQWVPFFAFGPGAELFGGVFDNSWLPQWLARLLDLPTLPNLAENHLD